MDSIPSESKNFFSHVFNFDNESKIEILNIIQYAIVAIVPIVAINKTMQRFIPAADDEKSSVEIIAEIVVQVICMFLGLLVVHRINTFIPTYSGSAYPEYNILFSILSMLMVTLSLQTKLGEKSTIITDRIADFYHGTSSDDDSRRAAGAGSKNANVRVTQPISNNGTGVGVGGAGQQYSDGTSISSLPQSQQPIQQSQTNYDNMYRNDPSPMVGAATPGMGSVGGSPQMQEPVAASDMGGFGGFSSW